MSNRGSFRQGRGSARRATVQIMLDGGAGAALTNGLKAWFEVPYPCLVERAKIEADQAGAIVMDLYRLTEAERMAGVAPAAAYSICSQSKPTLLASNQHSADSTLAGWETRLAAEDWLWVNIDSVTSISKVLLSLTVRRLLA